MRKMAFQTKQRNRFRTNKQISKLKCIFLEDLDIFPAKMIKNKLKEGFDAQSGGWNHRHFSQPQAQSFATTVLELEPCWMDRAVQVPQRILVIGILGDASNHEIMKKWDPFFFGIKLDANIW